MSEQPDMLGLDSEGNDILAHLDDDTLHQKSNWPGDLVELSEVARNILEEEGEEEEHTYRQIERVLLAIAFMCGGRTYYLPKGERIRNALRDKRIYDRFDGRNIHTLCREFKLTEQKLYDVIREQRQLHIQRVQHSMFQTKQA